MKKILLLILALALLSGCGKEVPEIVPEEIAAETEAAAEPRFTGDALALVTELGTMEDEPLAVSCWQAVESWCEAQGMERAVYETPGDSHDARLVEVARAIADGAEILVLPGAAFAEVVETVRGVYPHVRFLLVDGQVKGMENLACLAFAEEQGGALAGRAAVEAGYRKLGLPEQADLYTAGFRRGAEAAARELEAEIEFLQGEFEDWKEIEVFFADGELSAEAGTVLTVQKLPGDALEAALENWADYAGKTTRLDDFRLDSPAAVEEN